MPLLSNPRRPAREPRPQLTLGQRQGGLLAAGIPQGEHGSVALEEGLGLVQQHLPQPPHVAFLGGRSRVHGQVGPRGRRLPATLLQPLQPPDGQLARLRHLRGQGCPVDMGTPFPTLGGSIILAGERPQGLVRRGSDRRTEGQERSGDPPAAEGAWGGDGAESLPRATWRARPGLTAQPRKRRREPGAPSSSSLGNVSALGLRGRRPPLLGPRPGGEKQPVGHTHAHPETRTQLAAARFRGPEGENDPSVCWRDKTWAREYQQEQG